MAEKRERPLKKTAEAVLHVLMGERLGDVALRYALTEEELEGLVERFVSAGEEALEASDTVRRNREGSTDSTTVIQTLKEMTEEIAASTSARQVIVVEQRTAKHGTCRVVASARGRMPDPLLSPVTVSTANTALERLLRGEEVDTGGPEASLNVPGGEGERRRLTGVPLRDRSGRVLGALVALHDSLSPRVLEMLRRRSRRVAVELRNTLTSLQSSERSRQLALVHRWAGKIARGRPLNEMMPELLEDACETLRVDSAVLRLLEGDDLVLLASARIPDAYIIERLPTNSGIAARLLTEHRPYCVEDTSADPVTAEKTERPAAGYPFRSYAGAPLMYDGAPVGVLGFYCVNSMRKFEAPELDLILTLADMLVMAVMTDRLFRTLENPGVPPVT